LPALIDLLSPIFLTFAASIAQSFSHVSVECVQRGGLDNSFRIERRKVRARPHVAGLSSHRAKRFDHAAAT